MRLVAKENFAMLTMDGDEASAVRSTSPLTITTGGTYHLGGKRHPNKWRRHKRGVNQHECYNRATKKILNVVQVDQISMKVNDNGCSSQPTPQ